jgi:ribonuclease HI
MLPLVEIYTDGSCLTYAGGAGGYGVVLKQGDRVKELSGGDRPTKASSMELEAIIVALEALKVPVKGTVYTDAQNVIMTMNVWLERWKTNGWVRDRGKPITNLDQWKKIDALAAKHQLNWVWIDSEQGNQFSQRCVALARQEARQRK